MTDPGYRTLTPADLPGGDAFVRKFTIDVLTGLSGRPRGLSSRYFYDARGSELFRRIMALDEYYLTRCEASILESQGDALVGLLPKTPFNLVDLGAGDGAKTSLLLRRLADAPVRYVPIDISEDAMRGLVTRVRADHPGLDVAGIVSEYFDGIAWLAGQDPSRPNVVLFLGSNIGNFDKRAARAMLHRLWEALNEGDLVLIGFDLKKDIEALLAAYNDPHGVTAAFNLNLLERINRELGGTFDLSRWRHYGTYDVFSGAMESYLVSQEHQTVWIEALRASFTFEPWEPIHTEYSYKYLVSDVEALAASTGFALVEHLFDDRGWFLDSLWRVRKPSRRADLGD